MRAAKPPSRPRASRQHRHNDPSKPKPLRGMRAKVQKGKDVKAWSDARKEVVAARDARVAAGAEDALDDLEEAIMAVPKPEMANVATSVVKMKLASFCLHPGIRRQLDSFVMDSNIMVAEGYAFANLHITRLSEQGKPVPKVDQSFYHACMTAVTACKGKHSEEMAATIAEFDALRAPGQSKVESERIHDIREEVAISMAAVACNHLQNNLAGRLGKYLSLVQPALPKRWRKVVVDCVAVQPKIKLAKVERLSLKTKKGKDLSVSTRAAIAATVAVIEDLRRRFPTAGVAVACKAHTLLPLYHEMMRTVEAAYAASVERGDPPREIARLRNARFSLLPTTTGYTVSSIPICGRAMMAVLTRVDDGKGVKLARTKGADTGHDAAWRKHFNVNKVETRTRAFGGRISTDGYAVSVHMASTQANVLSTVNGEWDRERIERERRGKPVQYSGVDPGFTDVVTVAHSRKLQGLQPGADKSVPATVTSYSSSRYAEAAKLKASARRTAVWNAETAVEVASLELETDRSTVQGLSAFTRSYLAVYRTVLTHRATRGYRAMRFMRYVFKQRTVSAICDLIAPRNAYNVVGYGDWNGGSGSPIKRRWAGPQQDIRRELRRRSNVLFWNVWEHKTSVTCHRTWRRLSNMRAVTTSWKRSSRSMETSAKRVSVHKVLHCRSSDGAAGRSGGYTWNRDANASRNMLMLMMLAVLGVDRPKEFKPAVTVERPGGQGTPSGSSGPAPSLSSNPSLG